MNDLFKKALKFVLNMEGGYVNNPLDRGKATNKGITQKTYNRCRTDNCKPLQDIKLISDEEIEKIYFQYYWLESNCNNMTDKFAVVCFDSAVNHGVKITKQFLKAAEYKYIDKFIAARRQFYYKIVEKNPSQKIFIKGWLNRLEKLKKFIEPF